MRHRGTAARPSATAAALALATACSGPADRTPSAGEAQTVVFALHELARTAPDVEFGGVSDLDVDSQGRVYVGDPIGEVWVLDPDLRLERRVGRRGFGPGEFRSVGTVRIVARDSLYVYDPDIQRFSVYAPDSSNPAYTFSLASGAELAAADWAAPLDRRGSIAALYRTPLGDFREGGGTRSEVLRVIGPDGALQRDSVVTMREPESLPISTPAGEGYLFPPFARRTLFALSPAGTLYHAWSDSAVFTAQPLDGGPARVIRVDAPPRPITTYERDSVVQAMSDGAFPPQAVRAALERAGYRTWPALAAFFPDDRERLWIALTPPREGPIDWVVVDAEGRRVGGLRLPPTLRLMTLRGDRAYAIQADSLDVLSVVLFRVTAAPEAEVRA